MKDATLIRIGAMTMSDLMHESVLTCPKCSFASAESMPTDACQFFYECEGCGATRSSGLVGHDEGVHVDPSGGH